MRDPLVTLDVRSGRIFVGDAEELAKLLKLGPATASERGSSTASGQGAPSVEDLTTVSNSNGKRTTVREFARPFAQRKLYERIAILFHYAHRVEGRSSLTSRDLSDWFGLCGFKTPVRMDKALDNLKRQRRMVERTGPGQWALTAAGESIALDVLEPATADGAH
jgi:hypothetical protein